MLNLADFALQEQLEGNLMVAISRAWYNGSYTIAAKPIKSLELHYTMIQFLIKEYRPWKTAIDLLNSDFLDTFIPFTHLPHIHLAFKP